MKKPVIKERKKSPVEYTSTKKDYHNYTRTKYWKETRDTILQHRGYRCQFCGRTPEDGIKLTVHHSPQGYYYLGEELEHEDLMLVVCNICHFKGHKGKDNYHLFSKKDEIWKDIKDYEGLYQVSNWGRVKSIKFGDKILKASKASNGYLMVVLRKNNQSKSFTVHRLVAEAFLENPDNLPCVNHKDECKTHNWLSNLEFCSYKYNTNYGTAIEKQTKKRSKIVLQYDLNGNLIKEWKSASECGRNGFNQGNVSACCRGEKPQYKNYIWKYKN